MVPDPGDILIRALPAPARSLEPRRGGGERSRQGEARERPVSGGRSPYFRGDCS